MKCSNYEGIWNGFGWNVCSVDGHDIQQLYDSFTQFKTEGIPKAVIANTVKGKGVTFMENNNEWHHNRLTKAQYDLALNDSGEI